MNEMTGIIFFLKKNKRYFYIAGVFLLVLYYHYSIIPGEKKKAGDEIQEKSVILEHPTLDVENPEKIYEDVFQAQRGDFFRMGMVVKTQHKQKIEVFLQSHLNDRMSIGQLDIDPSSGGKYVEIIFPTIGNYQDIILRLKNDTVEKNDVWNDWAAYIRYFSVKRIDVGYQWEAKQLAPTVFGLSERGDNFVSSMQQKQNISATKNSLVSFGPLQILDNGSTILDYARLEDFGGNIFYSFALQNKEIDYTNIFSASESIRFDFKKRVVVGDERRKEFYVYKFDTAYPFEKFVLQALQRGVTPGEIRLEYSFDNEFWHEVSFTQKEKESQKFFLSLPGNGKDKVVYLRVSYNGKESKSGTFAIQELSVNASIAKNFQKWK